MKFVVSAIFDIAWATLAWKGAKEYCHEWRFKRLRKKNPDTKALLAIRNGTTGRWIYLAGQDEVDAYWRDHPRGRAQ